MSEQLKKKQQPVSGMEDQFVVYNHKKLRCGYTTGSCAAAAAKAAAAMLLIGIRVEEIGLVTPNGVSLLLPIEEISLGSSVVSCAVRKDGGDDIDATHGALVFADVSVLDESAEPKKAPAGSCDENSELPRVVIDGGYGVGRVTRPGLDQPEGAAAINHVPRQMIASAVQEVMDAEHFSGRLSVIIRVPDGPEIAAKTFNPRLGIVGGISILGTSGIVYPMSEKALIDTIRVELLMHHENGGDYLLITPGNYGERFADQMPELDRTFEMKCSNFVGETIDMAVDAGVKGILFVSHIGKFIKVSGGIMNTHSHEADCRAELMAAAALRAGGSAALARKLLETNTTEDALKLLYESEDPDWIAQMMEQICDRISFYLNARSQKKVLCGAIVFSNLYGKLGETKEVPELKELLHRQGLSDRDRNQ